MAYLYIKTFGCQMNVYDSHRIQDALEALGFTTVDQPDEADVMVLNTCHIREKADDKLKKIDSNAEKTACYIISRSCSAAVR